jgi:TonB family protein
MLKRDVVRRRANIWYGLSRALSLLMVSALLTVLPLASQTLHPSAKGRKLLARVEPEYPAPLKRLNIGGVVRVKTVIAPDGTVKNTTLLGGSPYLGQAAMMAIKGWIYARAVSDETLIVTIEFDPHR